MQSQHARDDAQYIRDMTQFRQQKDHFFGSSPQSPIPHEQRHHGFAGLDYYPPDPSFRIRAQVLPFEQPATIEMTTSTGDLRPQLRAAELRFQLGSQQLRLTGFSDPGDAPHGSLPHELFVPFRDATSTHDTYGAGRYIEVTVEHERDGGYSAELDFNLAYNPYCAYSEYYSCPIPPAENTLPIAITAGERNYGHAH